MQKDYRALDPKLFKAFMAAAELGKFTTAARVVHMTQSGVSQHISKLEQQIGVALFHRVGKGATLTEAGKKLAHFIQEYAQNTELFLEELRQQGAVGGAVSIALPPACVTAPQFTRFLQTCAHHPEFVLNVTLASNAEIARMLLKGSIDFGVVTEAPAHPDIAFEPLFEEEYLLVADHAERLVPTEAGRFAAQRFVLYPGGEDYLRLWVNHHFPGHRAQLKQALAAGARINSMEGAIRMVASGLCNGVFPSHAVARELANGALVEHRARTPALLKSVYCARMDGHPPARGVQQAMEWLRGA